MIFGPDLAQQARNGTKTMIRVAAQRSTKGRLMPDRHQTITQVLAELEMVSHGTTQSWNASGRGGDATCRPGQSGDLPPGELAPPHLVYRRRYDNALTDYERQGILRDARHTLKRAKHAPNGRDIKPEDPKDRDKRIANLQSQGWTWDDIARADGSTPSEVRKAAARHHATTGERTESVRTYAERNGISKSKVHRMFPGRVDRAA